MQIRALSQNIPHLCPVSPLVLSRQPEATATVIVTIHRCTEQLLPATSPVMKAERLRAWSRQQTRDKQLDGPHAIDACHAKHYDEPFRSPTMTYRVQSQGSKPEPSGLLDQRAGTDACFVGGSCEAIYAALQERGDAWSQDTLKALRKYAELPDTPGLLHFQDVLELTLIAPGNCLRSLLDRSSGLQASSCMYNAP